MLLSVSPGDTTCTPDVGASAVRGAPTGAALGTVATLVVGGA